MRISFLSFLVGCILIGVAVIGGGFEVKEIKMPRVGILVRLLSAGVGLAFISLGIGLDLPDPIGSSPSTAALAAGALTDTAGPPSPEAGVATQEDASVAYTDSAPAPTPASYADVFSGFSDSSTLTWSVQGVTVTGTTYMNGATGMIRIVFVDAKGQQLLVDEDLQLQQGEGKFWYAGSNPRYAGTETAVPEYRPDWFTVVQADGGWTFGEACDADGCNPVTVE